MTFSRKLLLAAPLAVGLVAGLPEWISSIEVRHKLEDVFYRTVTLGANTFAWRKPPRETRPLLTQQIQQAPAEAQLYYLRAREAEAQLDFPAAEADWAKYVQIAPARAAAWREKADFHQRRSEPEKELAALLEAAKLPATGPEIYRPVRAQQAWLALERAAKLIPDHLLSDDRALDVFRAREARYPNEPETYTRFSAWLADRKRWNDLEALIGRYEGRFPADETWPLLTRASIERGRNGVNAAIALYDRAFRPDWSDAPLKNYFQLLDEAGARRGFVATARQRHTADPAAADPAARLFHHFRLAGDTPAAQRVLHDWSRARNGRWTPTEQATLAGFHAAVQDFEQAARAWHAAYLSNDAAVSERSLAALIDLLITQAAQPFRFGGGDLSFYRDIAQLDANPGFWNGIVSLVLNGTQPAAELSQQERKATPYFHRAAAAELLDAFDRRFPQSARRSALHAQVIEASALHAESDRVVRLGTAYLAAFPDAPERTRVALATADAHARLSQTQAEFALYDSLLNELAARAGRVPIGETPSSARNVEYPRVLDRYIARLVAMRQPAQALALYRREIDRNPNDPGLYERLAAFLEQNKMTGEIEATYRRAIQQFPDKSWSHKLARFFLRQKMNAQFDAFTRDVAAAFSGTELEQYLTATAQQGALDPVLYRQVNLYAYRRFPHHLPFVRNLLNAYTNRATADPAEWERLLRAHWIYDETLRARFFSHLSSSGKLDAELAALRSQTPNNAPAALWVGEAEAWKSHFEAAAPLLKAVAADYPADRDLVSRAAALHRSLNQIPAAIQLEETLAQAHPTDAAILTRLGEMQAEQERYDRAAAYWNRIIAAAPGRAATHLEVATLHWDYYRYDEARARIAEARRRLNDPHLFAYEAGAICENEANLACAAREYVSGGDAAQRRLIKVATRPAWRQPIESALAAAGNNAATLALRVSLLESQSRKADIETLLTQAIPNAGPEWLAEIRTHAQRSGLVNVERRVLDRQYALADHPAAKMAALAERIRFEESANAPAAATAAADTLLRDYPRSVGAIRTAVNFFWRSGQKSRAPAALLAAAPNAYKTLQRQFRLEAIRKLTETGDYAAAHREAAVLLAADPADEQAIALKADAFARAGDDRGLAALYRDLLARPLAPVRAATLRRAWIPALIRLNDTTGAADQYIELLKQFSEDEALQREAARFAAASGQRARITAYFAKAESDSPRDPRWPIVRARLEHEFGDFNAALAAWGRAVALRPERVDILSSRALLEERLGQFDKATASYRKLYDISFHNPTWLESGARVLARQGKNDECVRWLREAFVDNRPANANGAIQVAQRLLEWGLAEPARAELARAPLTVEGAPILARAHATLRQLDSIPQAFNVQAIQSAAAVAGRLYTPEEKVRFGVWLESRRNGVPPEALASAALTAGLADIAARIYARNLPDHLDSLIRLQSQRQQFGELGRQLEAFARAQSNTDEKPNLLRRARSAYFAAGDDASELRVLQAIGEFDDRYFELLTRGGTVPQNRNDNFLDQLANYALRAGKAPVALQAIANRRGPLWQNAQRAAAGLYFGENSPAVRKAFIDILGPERIGEKLALAGNRDATLAGDVWFSYAGRYGAWLQLAQDTNSPHYLAALVERRSNSAAAYLALGEESYGATAEQAFRTALVLDEHQPIALSRLASLALARGDKPAATALWRQAVDELRWWQDNRRVQEWFWSEAARIFRESAAAGLRAELRDPIDSLLRAYVKRNGAYRVRDLLEGSLDATEIGTLARSAADPAGFLAQLNNESWLPESGRDALLKLQLDFAIDKLSRATGDERALARDFVENARIRYAGFLLRANRAATARPILEALIANPEVRQRYDVAELRLLLAVAEKRVAALLPDLPAEPEFLRNLGNTLRRLNYAAEARQVLAASYELDLKNGNVDAAIPGLAALHIEAGAPEKALPLFDVFVMQSAVPFARHLTAGELFLRSNRKAEAVRYLEPLVVAEPWNREARVLLAEARDDDAALATLAADANAPYASRLRAAQWLGANKPRPIQSGAGELDLLATNTAAAPAAEQPLWVAARRAAVAIARDNATKIRLYRGILAIAPTDDDSAVKLFRTLLAAGRPREASSSIEERQYALNELEDRARLADAQARAGDLPRALNTFEMLFNMAPPEQTRRYEPAHAALRAQAERNARNEARRPVVDKELEQRNIVKPRLLAPGGTR